MKSFFAWVTFAFVLAVAMHLVFPMRAHAQTTTIFTDGLGRPIEQAYTIGNNTFISSPWGAPLGTATTINGSSPTQPIIPMPIPAVPLMR